jgi:uncharacterized protein (DUF983 family)
MPLPRLPLMIARALVRRCPVCGSGRLFHRWFAMAERCPRCGLRFAMSEGAFLGSMSINYSIAGIAFFVFLGVTLAVTLPDPPVGLLIGGSLAVILVVLALFFPFSKTLWAAFEVALHDPADLDFGSST